jgi:2-dehydropantoate 2-reductase
VNAGIDSYLVAEIEEKSMGEVYFHLALASATAYLDQNISQLISNIDRLFIYELLNEITILAAVMNLPNDIILQ